MPGCGCHGGCPSGPSRSPSPPRDCGIEVVHGGIRLTPARIANAALEEGVARVSAPKGYQIQDIMGDVVDIAVGYGRAA